MLRMEQCVCCACLMELLELVVGEQGGDAARFGQPHTRAPQPMLAGEREAEGCTKRPTCGPCEGRGSARNQTQSDAIGRNQMPWEEGWRGVCGAPDLRIARRQSLGTLWASPGFR